MRKGAVISIVVLVTLANAGITYSILNNNQTGDGGSLDRAISEVESDWDFYKNIGAVLQIVNPEFIDSLEEEYEEEGSELQEILAGFIVYKINQDEEVKSEFEAIKTAYEKSQIEKGKLSSDSTFEKNTACAALVSGIREEIEPGGSIFGDDEFEYIFYSPTLNNCIYSVALIEDGKEGYKNYKVLYNASSNNEIGKYLVNVSYGFKGILGNEAKDFEDQISEDKTEYVKFVLENSYYNFDLFKDISYFYTGF